MLTNSVLTEFIHLQKYPEKNAIVSALMDLLVQTNRDVSAIRSIIQHISKSKIHPREQFQDVFEQIKLVWLFSSRNILDFVYARVDSTIELYTEQK
jgi:hypothetical protein